MSSSSSKKAEVQRPRALHNSRSFTRTEPVSSTSKSRPHRASTVSSGPLEYKEEERRPLQDIKPRSQSAAFAKMSSVGDDSEEESTIHEEPEDIEDNLPTDFDELPIELVSLTDSFIDSLSAKVHPTPPTVDKLSSLFQDFYVLAANHINTHIAALSLRQHRKSSPAPSTSSRSSVASAFRAKAASISSKEASRPPPQRKESEQQMLTTEEIAERKKARKTLEHKRVALEEAVERRVCEGIYDRIWRHRSTQDEAQDEKLRSKTAALSVVGIGLTDLGIDLGDGDAGASTADKEEEVRSWLDGARKELVLMNDEKHPLGKLQHLKAAHKGIVDTLSHFHPSSSADEIMPMLIYTLITSPPEGINVISNLFFIQRFRNETKIDGEAAYCLTNLEAAITFLETVDLASLRADENLSGPPKSASRPTTPALEPPTPAAPSVSPGLSAASLSPAVADPLSAAPTSTSASASAKESLRPTFTPQNRRLSELFQPPAQAFGAASDAMLSTADQGLKTINSSLGNSYKFLLGKLKERQENTEEGAPEIIVPKTLDDARRLISTPPLEDDGSASGASSLHSPEGKGGVDDKVLNLIGGKRPQREPSVESTRSSGSGKKVAFVEGGANAASPLSASNIANANPAIAIGENLRNLGNTFNPISRFAGIGGGMMKGFGRVTTPTAATTPVANPLATGDKIPDGGVTDLATAHPHLAASLPPKIKIAPPIKRFMEVKNPGELRINEVLELLRDYRRLAGALKDAELV